MPSAPNPLNFDIATQLSSQIDEDGFEDVQQNAEGEGSSGASPMERHHFYGCWGRALDPVVSQVPAGQPGSGQPDPAKGAQMLFAFEGSQAHGWTMEDPRVVPVIPTPDKGCAVFYGINPAAGQSGTLLGCCFVRTHQDGRISIATTTTGGGQDGQTVLEEVSQNGFVRQAGPYGTERFGSFGPPGGSALFTGYQLSVAGGARMTMGYIGGLPAGLGTSIKLTASMVRISGNVAIGPKGSDLQPVAQALPLVAVLQALSAALDGIGLALPAIATDLQTLGGGNASKAPIAAVAALVASAQTAVGGALAAISTVTAVG